MGYTYYPWNGANGEGRGRLSQIAAGTPGSPTSLMDLRYTDYDPVGNVKQIQDWKAGSPQTQSFTYDELNRLLSAGASGGSYGNYGPESYTYNAIGNLTSKGGVTYGYNDGAHKHAVTHLNGAQKYWYDANGNQVTRVVGSNTYNLSYDAENRLVGVTGSPVNPAATFVYGPSGERVKGTVNGVTTVYVGNHYEKQGATVRKYYYAGSQRVAMRENGVLYWLLVDHLGSTAIVANASGAKVGEVRYKAWGEERPACANPPCGTIPTTYRYTGQRWESGIGLYFYNARWYDPALGRFVQPDTVVPDDTEQVALAPLLIGVYEVDLVAQIGEENREVPQFGFTSQQDGQLPKQMKRRAGPTNPLQLNRYTYALANPIKDVDPSGHWTFQIGISFEGGLGFLPGFSVGFAIDDKLNIGVTFSEGGVATYAGSAGAGLTFGVTSANTIYDLQGPSWIVAGGSAAVGPSTLFGGTVGVGVGVDIVRGPSTSTGEVYWGGYVTVGVTAKTPWPIEAHSGIQWTQVIGISGQR